MFIGARASAAELYAKNQVFIRSNPDNLFAVNYYGPDNLMSVRPDGRMIIDRHYDAVEWPWKLNIELPEFNEGDSVLVVHRGDTCFLKGNDRFKTLKVESGGVAYLPVGNLYVGDLQLDAGSKIGFENQAKNTILYVKGKILWKSNFFYKGHRNFSYKSVAEHFKLVYSGLEKVFFDNNWYGTIVAPNAKIVLGQTHKKNLFGQFFADEIVIHQFSVLKNVPFATDELEYVFHDLVEKRSESL